MHRTSENKYTRIYLDTGEVNLPRVFRNIINIIYFKLNNLTTGDVNPPRGLLNTKKSATLRKIFNWVRIGFLKLSFWNKMAVLKKINFFGNFY